MYGQAAVGAPPMSVPHLDTRVINHEPGLLFGLRTPAGRRSSSRTAASPTCPLGAPGQPAPDDLIAPKEFGLLWHHQRGSPRARPTASRRCATSCHRATGGDWEAITAGPARPGHPRQRHQRRTGVRHRRRRRRRRDDRRPAGCFARCLDAVPAMLDVLEKCFGKKYESDWAPSSAR